MNILSADLTIGQNEVFILYVLLYSFTIQHVNSNTVSIKVVNNKINIFYIEILMLTGLFYYDKTLLIYYMFRDFFVFLF